MNVRVPVIGPCSVTTPRCAATAWCSAVTSLYPTSTVGSAPRNADQSTRSIIRCAPYPPRTQTIARTSGAAHAVREVVGARLVVAGQVAVDGVHVAHVRHDAHLAAPTTARTATPASSWSGGTGPDGATRATTSPSRSRGGRTPAVSGTEDGDVIGPSWPTPTVDGPSPGVDSYSRRRAD